MYIEGACYIQVMEVLGMKKAGPELGRLLAALMDWQLQHPNASMEEAKTYVREQLAKSVTV